LTLSFFFSVANLAIWWRWGTNEGKEKSDKMGKRERLVEMEERGEEEGRQGERER
jgi:hypothetical protein